MESITGDAMWTESSVNVYLGCEMAESGWSTLGGSVIRFEIVGTGGGDSMFDTYLCTTRVTSTLSPTCGST
jgi:hypothetical protein